jgi:hypothetical protein
LGNNWDSYHILVKDKSIAKVIAHLTGRDLTNLDCLFQQEVTKKFNLKHVHFSLNRSIRRKMPKPSREEIKLL